MIRSYFSQGVLSKGLKNNLYNIEYINPRAHVHNKHKVVDDRPFGGGPGMVMKYQPLADSIIEAKKNSPHSQKVVYLSPQGRPLTQGMVNTLHQYDALILLCGRYEGLDQRVIDEHVDLEISIGDYIVTGGEIPAMTLIDSMVRLIPGVLNKIESTQEDSFYNGLLDCCHYTRPAVLPNGSRSLMYYYRETI